MKYLNIILVLLIGRAFALKAQSVKNTSFQMMVEEIYAFDKIASPNSLDSLNHLKNLVNMSCYYCDSTTIYYHSNIVSKIYDMYPLLESYPSISDRIEWDLLNGMINIYFAEDNPFYNNLEVLFKFNCVIFDIICNIYPMLDENYKSVCVRLVALSYINNNIRDEIVQHWKNKIFSLNTHLEYINASSFLLYLFGFLSSNGESENAIALEQILLDKSEELFSNSSEYYIDCLQYLSVSYFNACNYPQAIELQKRVLGWYVDRQVPDKDLKNELRNLRHGLFIMGNYQEARMYGERLINSYEDKSNINYINDYSALAYCIFYSGEREMAISMLIENLKHQELRTPQNLAAEYSSISTLFRLNNDMVSSIKYAELALSSCNMESQEYNDLAVQYHLLVNLGNAYYVLNDIQSAFTVLNKAILVHNKLVTLRRFDKDLVQTNIILWTVLSRIYIISNDSKKAELALNKALDMAKSYGEDNINYLKIYAVLADICLIKGDGIGALNIYDHVLKNLDPSSRIYYSYLSGYSDYCANAGRYEEAFDAIKKTYSKTNSTVDLIKLSRLEYHFGNYDAMRKHLRVIFEQNKHLVNRAFLTYNNVQRKSYWWGTYVGEWFMHELPYLLLTSNSTDSLSIRTLYDAIVFSKGILLSTESDIRDLILNSNNTELLSKYERFLKLNRTNNSLDELKDYSYLTEEAQLESELMQFVRQHNTSISSLDVASNDIQRRLSNNSLAIEFMSVQTDTTAACSYYALVLEPDQTKEPQLINLFDSNQLDTLDSEKYYTTQHLTNLIWLPLREYIQKYDTIYFAPCKQLNSIAIEHLPCIDGEGFMSDSHTIYRLSNTRELLAPNKITQPKVGLFGGMIYNADLKNMDPFKESVQDMIENVNSIRSGHDYLPNSKIEVEMVDSIMNLHKIPSYMFTGLESTEVNFLNLCDNNCPRILHIATHGKYYSNEDLDYHFNSSELPFIKRSQYKNFYTEELALTQSALFFTGSDIHSKGDGFQPSSNDGILTAKEIASLNLEDVDLVVLSACQSGLGEIKEDGVFGLQRGFKKAGAQSLLMSLWDVDDHATQKLMVEFYKNLLSGKTKRESLHFAQKTLRQTENYKHPYYWAAFILLDALD